MTVHKVTITVNTEDLATIAGLLGDRWPINIQTVDGPSPPTVRHEDHRSGAYMLVYNQGKRNPNGYITNRAIKAILLTNGYKRTSLWSTKQTLYKKHLAFPHEDGIVIKEEGKS